MESLATEKTLVATVRKDRSLETAFARLDQPCTLCRPDFLRHGMPTIDTGFSLEKFTAHLADLNSEGRFNTTTGHHVIAAFDDYINQYLPQSSYSERLLALHHLDWGMLPTVLPMSKLKECKYLLGEGKLVEPQLITKTLVRYGGGYEDKNSGTHWDVPSGVCKSGGTRSEDQVSRDNESDKRKLTN